VNKYRTANNGYGSGLVPLLEHGDDLVIESDAVAKYVAQNVAVTDAMYPVDSSSEQQHIIDDFLQLWSSVTDKYYKLLCATDEEDVKNCEAIFLNLLHHVEEKLTKSTCEEKEGDFVIGKTFSVAECICAPWIQRFFVTLPYFRGIDFESEILGKLPITKKWMKAVCARESVIQSKCPEEEMLDAARRYYVSFVSPGAPGHL